MEIREPQKFGAVSDEQCSAFENARRCQLPEDYRSFLLKHNEGDPRPVITLEFGDSESRRSTGLKYFYGIHDGPNWASLQWVAEIFHGRIPDEGIPVASDEYGNQIVLVHRGKHAREIYFWDHEEEGT